MPFSLLENTKEGKNGDYPQYRPKHYATIIIRQNTLIHDFNLKIVLLLVMISYKNGSLLKKPLIMEKMM